MNCERTRQAILLAASGELDGDDAGNWREHLATCDDCQRFEADHDRITHDARASMSVDPGPELVRRVVAAAAEGRPRNIRRFPAGLFASRPLPSLAAAAAIALLIAGVATYLASRNRGGGGYAVHDDVGATRTLMELAFDVDETTDAEFDSPEEAIDALATEILSIDGMNMESFFSVEDDEEADPPYSSTGADFENSFSTA